MLEGEGEKIKWQKDGTNTYNAYVIPVVKPPPDLDTADDKKYKCEQHVKRQQVEATVYS